MGIFSKRSLKVFTYSMIMAIGVSTLLPTLAMAEEIKKSSELNSERDSSVLLEESLDEEVALKEKVELKSISEENDYDFLNTINISNKEGNLLLSFENEQNTYEIDVDTYKCEYIMDEDQKENQKENYEIVFSELNKESKIDIIFKNKNTLTTYVLSLAVKAELIEVIAEDITVELLKKETQENTAETETSDKTIEPGVSDEATESETNDESMKSDISDKTTESEVTESEVIDELIDSEVINKTTDMKQKSIMSSKSLSPLLKRTAVNGIYTIIPGDNLNSIAKDFGISLAQLAVWNGIGKAAINSVKAGQKLAISKLGVESQLSTAEKNKIYKGSTALFEKQEFIDYIAPYAVKVANLSGKEPLYASVIIAQAIHESAFGSSGLSNPPNYNLTGIKGSYNGKYVKMWTWEHDAEFKADINVLANFRKYPSYFEALLDHGDKMRYGTTWNSKIYAGTWIKNTTSYKEATKALDGVYATDPYGYANKLNTYIEEYHLTDYDKYDSFLTKYNVNYTATVSSNNEGIYTKPYGMKDAVLYTSYKYNNKEVRITEEATTQSGIFVKLVRLEDKGTIGWIKKSNINIYDEFLTKKNVNYDATVLTNNEGIYTKPKGMQGAILYTNYKYNNKEVKVGEEATTQSGTFVKLIRIEDRGTIGWIKKSGIQMNKYDTFITKKKVKYNAIVLPNNEGIYTKPQGMQGAILYTNYKYNNKKVEVGEEAITQSGTFVKLIRIEDRGTVGWIKKSGISKN